MTAGARAWPGGPTGTVADPRTLANELRARGVPYVSATVVRAERPTSAHAGDSAVVLGDGAIVGFVGGACAESSVRLHALRALRVGSPVLLRIAPSDSVDPAASSPPGSVPGEAGSVTVANHCVSGGTLEIFLEPVVPAPLVVVHGDAPVARALCAVGQAAGFAVERGGARADLAEVLAVVVATHGRDELRLLQAALEAQVPYIGLVASPRRGAAVLEELAVPDEARARIRTPAGLDLGARRPGEIAVSIWAEIVAVHAERSVAGSAAGPGNEPALAPAAVPGPVPSGSSPAPAPPGPPSPVVSPAPAVVSEPNALASPAVVGSSGAPGWPVAAEVVIDPVCGMEVAVVAASAQCISEGVQYYFCGSGCQQAFEADPGAFTER